MMTVTMMAAECGLTACASLLSLSSAEAAVSLAGGFCVTD